MLFQTFVTMLCAMWRRRNDRVWGGIMQPVAHVIHRAMDFLYEWNWAQSNRVSTVTEARHQQAGEQR